jgi:thiol-disulfide isomerase/thioredoxin
MARRLILLAVLFLIAMAIITAFVWTLPAPQPEGESVGSPTLARDGAFGFPQGEAQVLFDDPNLRVSVFNDAQHLFVQAIVWSDGDDALGETNDGRAIGDRSYLEIDVDADAALTPNVDRRYWLDLWPHRLGLYYQIKQGRGRSSHILDDSEGRGSIRYVDTGRGTVARVDSFLIPLSEIGRETGDPLRLAYWARSESPDLILNSLGIRDTDPYAIGTLPQRSHHAITLAERQATLDPTQVPRGRGDAAAAEKPMKPLPQVGSTPPEFTAADWINADGPQTLANLRGQVVLIDFWTTACADCVNLIPHLNDLHECYASGGLRILGFTNQSRRGIESFLQRKQAIGYTIGTGSNLDTEYGVRKLPYAFLVGRDGRLLWHGRPTSADIESRVVAALGTE